MSSNEQIKDRLQGILPALVTPVDENGQFVPEVCERLLARVYEAGSHGVYACGQTGEGLLQSVAIAAASGRGGCPVLAERQDRGYSRRRRPASLTPFSLPAMRNALGRSRSCSCP